MSLSISLSIPLPLSSPAPSVPLFFSVASAVSVPIRSSCSPSSIDSTWSFSFSACSPSMPSTSSMALLSSIICESSSSPPSSCAASRCGRRSLESIALSSHCCSWLARSFSSSSSSSAPASLDPRRRPFPSSPAVASRVVLDEDSSFSTSQSGFLPAPRPAPVSPAEPSCCEFPYNQLSSFPSSAIVCHQKRS
uniref:Putative secreted protein n=1 Tax=Anopheles darlingi TaxID=43151 RepID=A0A2M4D0U5_ANODA